MIKNERQYTITKSQMEKFRDALKSFRELDYIKGGIDPVVVRAQRAAVLNQLKELEKEVERFEALQSGAIAELYAASFKEIGERLIEARIASGLTQQELAGRIGWKPQQIQRYEQGSYETATLPRLETIAGALDIDVAATLRLTKSRSTEPQRVKFSKAVLKTMRDRKWLAGEDSDELPSAAVAARYITSAIGGGGLSALNKQTVRVKGKYDESALAAWKARVLNLAREAMPKSASGDYADPHFLKALVRMSIEPDGPEQAIRRLRDVGISVVVERHLERTHLDGAALLLDGIHPVIGITLRHDRLDNFWFVLFHELAHIILHRETGLRDGFFDDAETDATEKIEQEADDFARNALISDELWRTSFVQYSTSAIEVRDFANRVGIHPAIVAGRIRRERNKYTILGELIGLGEPRRVLSGSSSVIGSFEHVQS